MFRPLSTTTTEKEVGVIEVYIYKTLNLLPDTDILRQGLRKKASRVGRHRSLTIVDDLSTFLAGVLKIS